MMSDLRRRLEPAFPFLVFLLVAQVLFLPASLSPWAWELDGAFFLGELSNAFVLKQGLIEHHRVVTSTDVLGYPQQGVLVFIAWGNLLFIILGDLLGSALAGYNLSVPFNLALAGWFGMLLTERVGGSRAAAWIGGLFFAFNPFVLGVVQNGQVSYSNHAWIALYALLLIGWMEKGGWPRLLGLGLTAAWVVLNSPYFGVFCWLFTPLVPAWWLLRRPDRWRTTLVRTALVFAVCVAAQLGPYLYFSMLNGVPEPELLLPAPACPAEELLAHGGVVQPGFLGGTGMGSAGLFAIFLPLGAKPENMLMHLDYLGASTFLVLLAAAVLRRRGAPLGSQREETMAALLPWVVGAVGFAVLALGPYLVLTEEVITGPGGRWIPMPFLLLWRFMPFFERVCTPYRFLVMTSLCLAPVLGLLLGPVLARLVERRRVLVVAGIGLVMMLDYTLVSQVPWPLPWRRVEMPRVFEDLAADPEPFAILELPYQEPKGMQFWYDDHIQPTPPFWNERLAFHQTVHGKRLGVRMTVIALPEVYERSDLVRNLADQVAGRETLAGSSSQPGCGAVPVDPWLVAHDFRYLVVHEHLLTPTVAPCLVARLEASLVRAGSYPDEGISLWRFEAPAVDPGSGAAPAPATSVPGVR